MDRCDDITRVVMLCREDMKMVLPDHAQVLSVTLIVNIWER